LKDYRRKKKINSNDSTSDFIQVEEEDGNNSIISEPIVYDENQNTNSTNRFTGIMKKFKEFSEKITKKICGIFSVRNTQQNIDETDQPRFSGFKSVIRWCLSILVTLFIFYIMGIFYLEFIYPKKLNKIDEQMIYTAQNDSTKAIEIAKWFLEHEAHYEHSNFITEIAYFFTYNSYMYERCGNNHRKIGEKLLREAAEKGNADAQFAYAMNLFVSEGWCKGTDYTDNKKNGFIAAWNGLDTNLEYMLKSYIVTSSFERAAYWLKKSADNGNADAAAYLGFFYEHGLGVKQDLWTAQVYTLKAAQENSVYGIYRAGIAYSEGVIGMRFDTKKDKKELFRLEPEIKEALRLWNIAADRGYEYAKIKVEKIYDEE
jgi:TPR repeat protein